jgi:hypothetical protein
MFGVFSFGLPTLVFQLSIVVSLTCTFVSLGNFYRSIEKKFCASVPLWQISLKWKLPKSSCFAKNKICTL